MKYLALDLGKRHTGVAYLDTNTGVSVPLIVIQHKGQRELLDALDTLAKERKVRSIILGLPLLPGGKEGKAATESRIFAETLRAEGYDVDMIDERYTSPRTKSFGAHANAALAILQVFAERLQRG